MAETGVAIIISLGNYTDDPNKEAFNQKVSHLVDLQSTVWGSKNMGYKLLSFDEKAPYLSKNSLVDFIKESRFDIKTNDFDYLVINIIGKGNEQYLKTSDNQQIELEKIIELFSFSGQFFVPTVFNIDVFDDSLENKQFTSCDVDYGDNLNVFGYVSNELDYFGFITNAVYQRKNALYLKDVINHIMIWNKYIFTVPKDIDFDPDDDDPDYEQREVSDTDNMEDIEAMSLFQENVKSVSKTTAGGHNWSITYSIDRKSWGPFLCKYDFSAFVHDNKNNRKDIKSIKLEIERPIGIKKQVDTKKILQNGSFLNETIREEGKNAVGNTALTVIVTNWNQQIITTPKISIT